MEIRTFGVVGAGTMGAGIAQVAAMAGFPTVVVEIVPAALERGLQGIEKSLERLVAKGKLTADASAAARARLRPASTLTELAGADLVVEAVVERFDVKRQVLVELDRLVGESAVLATNTSSISITRLAAQTRRPDRVIGMHFMNPVPVMHAGRDHPRPADLATDLRCWSRRRPASSARRRSKSTTPPASSPTAC